MYSPYLTSEVIKSSRGDYYKLTYDAIYATYSCKVRDECEINTSQVEALLRGPYTFSNGVLHWHSYAIKFSLDEELDMSEIRQECDVLRDEYAESLATVTQLREKLNQRDRHIARMGEILANTW